MPDAHHDNLNTDPMYYFGTEHWAERLMKSQKLEPGSPYLAGQAPPTPQQVSAVLHALADHTLQTWLCDERVLELGADRAHLGEVWRQASARGRFFQRLGDWLARS